MSGTSTRGQQLAEELDAVCGEFAAFVKSASAEEWARRGVPAPDTSPTLQGGSVGEDEKRPANCLAYHIAAVIGAPHTYLIGEAVAGKPLDLVRSWTVDNVAEWNAGVAQEQLDVTQAEVLELLRSNTKAAVELLRSLSDEQLQRPISSEDEEALVPWCGGARTVEELVQRLLIGHVHLHRSSLRATVGR